MPELPEVETIVRGLSDRLMGQTIESVHVLTPSILHGISTKEFQLKLSGVCISSIRRHGKFIFIRFQNMEACLQIHLGMTGQLLFESNGTAPLRHTHVIFKWRNLKDELRYRDIRRFGHLKWLQNQTASNLGPDAWDSPDPIVFAALRKKSGMIKHALLNQHVVAGLGNIYVDESLYRAKLHPRRTLESISTEKLHILCTSIRTVLKESIDLGGTSFRNYVDTEGGRGGYKGRLLVYGKEGAPCPLCRTSIRRIQVAGRSSHLCPKCQQIPRTSVPGR